MSVRPFLLAFVLAVLSGTLVLLYVRKVEIETSGGNPVRVLVLRAPIEPGGLVTDDVLTVRAVPQAWVESRAIREGDRDRVIGIRVETSVKAQQTLLWTDLAVTTDDHRYLTDVVQPGMRALGIRASADDRHFALLRAGDRVDVVASLPTPGAGPGDGERTSVLLAQNLLVLAVGVDMGGEIVGPKAQTSERGETGLTLSATIQQVQQLTLAAERGKLSVAIRSRGETQSLDGVPEFRLRQLLSAPPPKAAAPTPTPKGPVALGGEGKP